MRQPNPPIILFAIIISALIGCQSDDDDAGNTDGNQQSGAGNGAGAGGPGGTSGGGAGAAGTSGTGGNGGDSGGGGEGGTADDGAVEPGIDGGMADSAVDGGDSTDAGADGGWTHIGTGGCCDEHDDPGCEDADIEACVCEKLPDCCTNKWDLPCVLIVEQKFCEPGVRECLCGPESEGGWEQTSCCETEWTGFCKDSAVIKCGARAGC